MFDQLPPHDVAAEEAVLGSLMVADDVAALVAPIVSARDFYREHNAWCFEACMALWERGESINQVTVAHELERRGRLDDAGGLSYISDLINDLPTPVGVEHSAAIVKRDAMYRRMLTAAVDMAQLAYQGGSDFNGALARAEALVYGLRQEVKTGVGFTLLADLLGTYLDLPEETEDDRPRALQTVHSGLRDLDAILMGLRAGDLVIVGAQTSVGKTALMCNITANCAVTQDARVAFFTLEMTAEQLARRFLAGYSRVTTAQIERRSYSDGELQRVMSALGVLGNAAVYIKDARGYTMKEIRRECMDLARDKGLDLVVIDYLGKITHESDFGTDNSKVGKVTKAAAELAGDLDVPVIMGSQLRRFDRADQRPSLNDLRDSGNIEQDATVVIFIHREERHTKRQQWERDHPDYMTEPYPVGQAELIVAKNRNGPLGTAQVRYRAAYTKFEDFDLPAKAPVQGLIPEMYLNGNGVGAHV